MTGGPGSLKLVDVAAAAGVSHATVVHHFGSIEDVQTALMERMIAELVGRMMAPDGEATVVERIDALFDAFAGGGARLAGWIELKGDSRRLTLVKSAIRTIVEERVAATGVDPSVAEDGVLFAVVLALGVGLFGPTLAALLDRPANVTRDVALRLLLPLLEGLEMGGTPPARASRSQGA